MPWDVDVVVNATRSAREFTVPYRSVNPATGEVPKTFSQNTDQHMMDALASADRAFVSWSARPIEEHAKIISRSAQLLLERKSELSKLASLELSSLISRLTIRRTRRNSLVLLRWSFPRRTKLKRSRLQTIRHLDSVDRFRQILRGPSASSALSRQGWSSSTIQM